MSFKADSTGIEDAPMQNKLLPKGWYPLEIIQFMSKAGDQYPREGKSKNGDDKVDVLLEVSSGAFKGERIFHSVTFLPKERDGKPTPGAGMWVHWLKSIGEPWEGKVDVMPDEWIGKRLQGYVIEDEYNGKKKNKLGEIKPITGDAGEGLPF